MLVIKKLMVPIEFHSIYCSTMEVDGMEAPFQTLNKNKKGNCDFLSHNFSELRDINT